MYHPSLPIMIFVSLLLSCKNRNLFNIIAIIYPILLLFLLPISDNISIFEISAIKLIANFSSENTSIARAFTIISLSANCYSISQKQRLPVIIGGFYFASCLVCLYTDDVISFFISMELMMVASSILLYLGGSRQNLLAAKQYFITHLTSGSIILIGICCLISKTDDIKMVILTELISQDIASAMIAIIIFVGCLVNVAAIPFSWWMTNCYPIANSASFIYLSSFTTKIAILTLIKLFYGFVWLKWFGVLMIIYGGVWACIHSNLKSLLCYLAIAQLGYLMTVIGSGTQQLSELIIIKNYIANHIIYNALFAVLIVVLADNAAIMDCTNIKRIRHPIWVLSVIVVLLMFSNFPFTSNFLYKIALAKMPKDSVIDAVKMLFNIIIFVALPVRAYFNSSKTIILEIDKYQISSMLILVFTLVVTNLKIIYTHILPSQIIDNSFIMTATVQLAFVILGIILAISLKITRRIEQLSKLSLFKKTSSFINSMYIQSKIGDEDSGVLEVIKNLVANINIFQNQQNAIAIVFLLLSSLLIAFTYSF